MYYKGSQFRKPRLSIVTTQEGVYWSAIFPTQRHKLADRKEVLKNLANTVRQFQLGDVEVVQADLTAVNAEAQRFLGGFRQLMAYATIPLPKVKAPKRRKNIVRLKVKKHRRAA